MCGGVDTGLDFLEQVPAPKREGLSVVIHRLEEELPIRNWYIPSGTCYELVETKELTSEANLARYFKLPFIAFVESPEPGKGTQRVLYSENELHDFLAEYFDCPRRPSWQEYFLKIAEDVATRSTCLRRQVGAVAVNPESKNILATGYNGSPRGCKHCLAVGCLRDRMKIPSGEREELCRAVHAEANLVAQAALHGVSLKGSVVYCLVQPCLSCLKLLINAGVKKVYFVEPYPHNELLNEFVRSGVIELEQIQSDRSKK